jgi:probable F420-dependent oxidoreductase
MKLGITLFATDYAMRPDDLAKACEERGFESVWFPEHTHIPASLRTPPPIGTKTPRYLWHLHDLFVTLTAAAVVTETIKIGSGICLVVERDPITLAKAVASVDQLSHGRLLFGIGAGWNAEEMEHHGTPFARRWTVLRERIEAMKRIWTEEAAEYHGEFVNFDPIWSYPKPLQRPHPPILLGTLAAKGLHRVVQYCNGWIPTGGTLQDLPAAITELHARAARAGRRPSEVPVSIFGATSDEATLHKYQELGVERAVLTVPSRERDHVLPLLDTYAALIAKFA